VGENQREPTGAGSPLKHEMHARAVDVGAMTWVKEFTRQSCRRQPNEPSHYTTSAFR